MEEIKQARRLEAEGRTEEAAALYEAAHERSDEDWLAVKAGAARPLPETACASWVPWPTAGANRTRPFPSTVGRPP